MMSEKGGKKSAKYEDTPVDSKVITTAIISTLVGALFVLVMIFIGMRVNESYHLALDASNETEEEVIMDILPVKYELSEYSYTSTADEYQKLSNKLGKDGGYTLIKSNTEYTEYLNTIAGAEAVVIGAPLDVDSDFFSTGSILMVSYEEQGLTSFSLDSMTRDADYNVYINTVKRVDVNADNYGGHILMIKIENMQPKHIEVNVK